jgi:hypothetical protein
MREGMSDRRVLIPLNDATIITVPAIAVMGRAPAYTKWEEDIRR